MCLPSAFQCFIRGRLPQLHALPCGHCCSCNCRKPMGKTMIACPGGILKFFFSFPYRNVKTVEHNVERLHWTYAKFTAHVNVKKTLGAITVYLTPADQRNESKYSAYNIPRAQFPERQTQSRNCLETASAAGAFGNTRRQAEPHIAKRRLRPRPPPAAKIWEIWKRPRPCR